MMNEDRVRDFYWQRNVMVIGGAGFVGNQLVKLLLYCGALVHVVDDFSRGITRRPGASYSKMDVGRTGSIPDLADKMRTVDCVFNLAATVAGVLYNESHHLEMYRSNVGVLACPLVAAERAGVEHYLNTSSVCVYAPEHNYFSREENGLIGVPHEANAGYAEAKRDGERMVQWSSIKHAVSVRPSNVAGPGDYYDDKAHVIPALIKRAANTPNGEMFQMYGSGEEIREFIHPEDVAAGMMYALALTDGKATFNIGCNGKNTISMIELAKVILLKFGRDAVSIVTDSSRGGGDSKRCSSAESLMALGWGYRKTLSDIISESILDFRTR